MVKKIEFLNRLFQLASCIDELIIFLREQKLLSDYEYSVLLSESDKTKWIYNFLESLKKSDKLLLLDYEWQVLPIERLKLTLITERTTREFTYNT